MVRRHQSGVLSDVPKTLMPLAEVFVAVWLLACLRDTSVGGISGNENRLFSKEDSRDTTSESELGARGVLALYGATVRRRLPRFGCLEAAVGSGKWRSVSGSMRSVVLMSVERGCCVSLQFGRKFRFLNVINLTHFLTTYKPANIRLWVWEGIGCVLVYLQRGATQNTTDTAKKGGELIITYGTPRSPNPVPCGREVR